MSKANVKREQVGGDSKNHKEVNEYTINIFIEELRKFTEIEIKQSIPQLEAPVHNFIRESDYDGVDDTLKGSVNMYLLALLM